MAEFKNPLIFCSVLIGLSSTLLFKTYVKKDYFHQAVKTVFEYQFERTEHYKKILGDENVYPVFCDADTLMKKIYFKKYQTKFECKISSDSIISNMENVRYDRPSRNGNEKVSALLLFSEFIKNLKTDYLIISSSIPTQQAVVKEYYPYLIENTQTQAINYKLYSKRKEDAAKRVEDDKITYYSDLSKRGSFNYSKGERSNTLNNTLELKIDSLNEFPFDAKADLNSVFSKEGEVILVSAILKLKQERSVSEICISVNDRTTNESYSYAAKDASEFVRRSDSTLTIYSEYFNGTKYKSIKDKSVLSTYLWNKGKESLELKSFDIKVIDYWPMKWHFWD